MKNIFIILIVSSGLLFGQFKEESNVKIDLQSKILANPTPSLLLNFINLNNLEMNHSFGMSYSAAGNNSFALGVYTNSLYYKISDKIDFVLETSILNSPYSSLGKEFSDGINGIYISNAQLNYKISENSNFTIQFSNDPRNYYNPYYRGSSLNPFWHSGNFIEDDISN